MITRYYRVIASQQWLAASRSKDAESFNGAPNLAALAAAVGLAADEIELVELVDKADPRTGELLAPTPAPPTPERQQRIDDDVALRTALADGQVPDYQKALIRRSLK